MQNINKIISECQSFIMDQALIIDDSKNSNLNSWANTCLLPLATLLKRGKMCKFQIDSERKISEIKVYSNGIHPTLAKILVIFATTIAVLLKTINYCISPDARDHLALFRSHREQEKNVYKNGPGDFLDISTIISIPYSEANDIDARDSKDFWEPFTLDYFNSLNSNCFRGCYTFGESKFELLAYKYTSFFGARIHNIEDNSFIPRYYIRIYYATQTGIETNQWNEILYLPSSEFHDPRKCEGIPKNHIVLRNILSEGQSDDYNEKGIKYDSDLPLGIHVYYLGHVTLDMVTSQG